MIRCSIRIFSSSGKIRDMRDFLVQHLQLDDHVPEQLALGRVSERPGVGQLVDLADVVQEDAGEQQVAIDHRIVAHRSGRSCHTARQRGRASPPMKA